MRSFDCLAIGELDRLIYESYVKLMKEQKRFEINIEDQKRINKQFGKLTKEAKNIGKNISSEDAVEASNF